MAGAVIVATTLASLFVVSLVVAPSARAQAQDAQATDMCACEHVATIQSLQDCVEVMATQGIITNHGVAKSLLATLRAAQTVVNHQQPGVAVPILTAFTWEVRAHAGRHIAQPHADHLILHAKVVIQALRGSDTA